MLTIRNVCKEGEEKILLNVSERAHSVYRGYAGEGDASVYCDIIISWYVYF